MGHASNFAKKHRAGKPGHRGMGVENWTEQYSPNVHYEQQKLTHVEFYADPNAVARNLRDHWTWPYPSANYQVQVMNGWVGNQLPGCHKEPWQGGISQEWVFMHQQQYVSPSYRGTFGQQLSQGESAQLLQRISQAWQNIRG